MEEETRLEERGVDHTLLRALQLQVGTRLDEAYTDRARRGLPTMSPADADAFKTSAAHDVVDEHVRILAERGTPMSWEHAQDLVKALIKRLTGFGSLDDLLRNEDIEDISINGHLQVFVDWANGARTKEAPVFDSNEELIETIQTLAAHEGLSGRAFDTANPMVNFRVGTSRFQAVMGVSPVPCVSIRLHPKTRLFGLKDLVANGTIDQPLADFFAAAVQAKKNMIIGGETKAGKTVLLRALANEIDLDERLLTIERALELGLDDDKDREVIPMEERLPNAEGEGAVPMRKLLEVSKRMRPDRVIVGEVLGDEILTMLNAMMQGNDGSLSTIHANSSEGIVETVCSYAVQAPERLPRPATISMIANGLDFLVFVKRRRGDGQQRRFVSSVLEIVGYDEHGLKTNPIFKPGHDGMAVRDEPVAIACLEDLLEAGYRDGHQPGAW